MSYTSVPRQTQLRLWGKAAGRCEYEGCNDRLWLDSLTKFEFNVAYLAHIVADRPDGPRGHPVDSEKLAKEISNLMLLCDKHHRLIDVEQEAEHPVDRLTFMKQKHESRIEFLGSLTEEKQSHVLLYGANIGAHASPVSFRKVISAMLPDRYPAETQAIEIGIRNSAVTDRDAEFWKAERINLEAKIAQILRPRLALGEISHLSVFAAAPQPLLMLLGANLSDIPTAEIFQLHREPANWQWQEPLLSDEFLIEAPNPIAGPPALVFSLSGTVNDDRVRALLPNASIWKVSVNAPHNDFLKSREQAKNFRRLMRSLLDQIKQVHGQAAEIHVFPAMPVALAVEFGRVRMPKADLPCIIYDEDRQRGGFRFALSIGAETH